MKAITHERYGPPGDLVLRDIDPPQAGEDQVLIQVHAAGVNPYDWHMQTGKPYLVRLLGGLRRPKSPVLGADVAGVVEAVGPGVSGLAPGDAVFGNAKGSFAELALATADKVAPKPATLSFSEAAALPIAGLTALQALRDHAKVEAGQSVLVNGASGGVGSYAVQIAAALGATVTGVCSTPNLDLVRSLGASTVIDYSSDDVTASGQRYDVIVDCAGSLSASQCQQLLTPSGVHVGIGGPKDSGDWLAPILGLLTMKLRFLRGDQRTVSFVAKEGAADLEALAEMVAAGQLRPVIGASYPLADAASAVDQVGSGHTRGKLVVSVIADDTTEPAGEA